MSRKDLLVTVLGNLGRMKGRTAMTAGGVAIGTTALVLLVSLGVGLQRMALRDIGKQFGAANIVTVVPYGQGGPMGGPTQEGPPAENPKKKAKLDEAAVKRFKRLAGVEAVVPGLEIPVSRLRYKRWEGPPFSVVGVGKEAFAILDFKAVSGILSLGGKKVFLGAQVPKQFYRKEGQEPAGKLKLAGERLDIFVSENGGGPAMTGPNSGSAVSVSESSSGKENRFRAKVAAVLKAGGFENDYRIYISERQAKKLAKVLPKEVRSQFSWVKVKVKSTTEVAGVQKRIEGMGYGASSLEDMLKGINQVFVIMQAVLGGVASIALLVAAFGIANTMIMAIYERTKEIGIMKAIGAASGDIMRIFLAEAATIGLIGGVVGVTFGYLGGKLINWGLLLYFASAMKEVKGGLIFTPLWLIVFTLLFATGIGLLSGILPAARAARLSPLGALRHE